MSLFTEHGVVGILQDGKIIAFGVNSTVIAVQPGTVAMVVRLPDLRMIETVLNVEFYSNPDTNVVGGYMDKKITGNVVGMSLYSLNPKVQPTTIEVKVVAVGV